MFRVNNQWIINLDVSAHEIETVTPFPLLHGIRIDPFPIIEIQEDLEDPNLDDTRQHLKQKYHKLNAYIWDGTHICIIIIY